MKEGFSESPTGSSLDNGGEDVAGEESEERLPDGLYDVPAPNNETSVEVEVGEIPEQSTDDVELSSVTEVEQGPESGESYRQALRGAGTYEEVSAIFEAYANRNGQNSPSGNLMVKTPSGIEVDVQDHVDKILSGESRYIYDSDIVNKMKEIAVSLVEQASTEEVPPESSLSEETLDDSLKADVDSSEISHQEDVEPPVNDAGEGVLEQSATEREQTESEEVPSEPAPEQSGVEISPEEMAEVEEQAKTAEESVPEEIDEEMEKAREVSDHIVNNLDGADTMNDLLAVLEGAVELGPDLWHEDKEKTVDTSRLLYDAKRLYADAKMGRYTRNIKHSSLSDRVQDKIIDIARQETV